MPFCWPRGTAPIRGTPNPKETIPNPLIDKAKAIWIYPHYMEAGQAFDSSASPDRQPWSIGHNTRSRSQSEST